MVRQFYFTAMGTKETQSMAKTLRLFANNLALFAVYLLLNKIQNAAVSDPSKPDAAQPC